jgi:hypothetical protein
MISTSSLEAATGDSGFAFENPIELLYIADMLYAALTFDKSLILTIRLKRFCIFVVPRSIRDLEPLIQSQEKDGDMYGYPADQIALIPSPSSCVRKIPGNWRPSLRRRKLSIDIRMH